MKKESLKKNFIYQIIYQIIILVIPLIISPFLTRTLGKEQLGIYSYTFSIVTYFMLFAKLGIEVHGQRVISKSRNDEVRLRKTFWSLFTLHFISSFLSVITFIIFALCFGGEYTTIYLIEFLMVVSAVFDCTWLFYGLEDFKSVVIKNTVIKILECVAIFLFVKNSNSIYIYVTIMSISSLLSQLSLIPKILKTVKPIKFSKYDLLEHIKPILILFISSLAATLYTVFDKTLIGLMIPDIENVAFYEYSNKIINIPKTILAIVGIVFFPRCCNAVENQDVARQKKYIDISMLFVLFGGSAFMFGIAAISNKLSILYFGEEFKACGQIIAALSPIIILIPLGDVFRREYLLPAKKDNIHIFIVIGSALINIILSASLIPIIGVYGAIIGTAFAELFGTLFTMIYSKSTIDFKIFFKKIVFSLMIGVTMFLCVYFLDVNTDITWTWLLIEIALGAIVYVFMFICYLVIFDHDAAKYITRFFKKNK